MTAALAALGALVVAACTPQEQVTDTGAPSAPLAGTNAGERLHMELEEGLVVIRLRPDLAPQHVERIKALAGSGFYDGTPFHRVIDGFMAQGGDPTGTGAGGSSLPDLAAEFTDTPFVRGVVGAARTNNPHSANSQFFIMFDEAPFLDGAYTVWGEVESGMELVDRIKRGEPVSDPDRIVTMRVIEGPS